MELLHQRLGPHALLGDRVKLGAENTTTWSIWGQLKKCSNVPHLGWRTGGNPWVGDQYVNAEIYFPRGDKMTRGQVVHWKQDPNGNPIGRSNQNPILDTYLYKVEFPWGRDNRVGSKHNCRIDVCQCDIDGNENLLLEAFFNQRKNGSVLSVNDQKIVVKGWETLRKSTAGWDICCKSKDGSTLWEKLLNHKELHPIQVAKYAIAQVIQHKVVFKWWVHHFLREEIRLFRL